MLWFCCNLSGGVALIVWFTTNRMCVKNNTIHICGANKQQKSDRGVEALPTLTWNSIVACCHSAKFCACAARDFRSQQMVLWTGCEGRAEFSLHTKSVRSVRFVVKRRGCCCNLSGGVALIVWFTTNRMCVKNKQHHTYIQHHTYNKPYI